MTDKEKLEKIKVLADAMYNRMQNLTTDTSGIRKAMYDYHQFIIYEYYKEESVSIWHNMDEVPIKGEVIVVQTKDTFYGLSVQKGGSTYKNRNKDRYVRWAYASDLLNLPNVQSAVKNWKKPVSKDLEEACDEYYDETWDEHGGKAMVVDGCHDIWFPSQATDDFFKAGAQWQKEQLMKDAVDGVVFTELDDGSIMVRTHYFKSDKIDYLDEVKLIIIKEE